jgi:kynureninase
MNISKLEDLFNQASALDSADPLKEWVTMFPNHTGILCDGRGNSLGRQPQGFKQALIKEAEVWEKYGHDGHFQGEHPWWTYHEFFEKGIAQFLGCDASIPEAVIGNTLSVNNYLLLLEFMRLGRENLDDGAVISLESIFGSDTVSLKKAPKTIYEGESDNADIIFLKPDHGDLYSTEYIEEKIIAHDASILFLPIICHKTGQRFEIERLAKICQTNDVLFGLDLAHGMGNIPLELSKWKIDFATFCSYKYMNGGPGGVGGFYINKGMLGSIEDAPGWWGISKETRFGDPQEFKPAKGARRLLSSNDQIFNSIGLKLYLYHVEKFFGHDLAPLFAKHTMLSQYTFDLLSSIRGVKVITPQHPDRRGCQISFRVPGHDVHEVLSFLKANSCFIEDRGDVLRTAFVGYSTYGEPALLAETLYKYLNK